MPRARSWRSTIDSRSGDTFWCPHVCGPLDAEMRECGRHHVGDAADGSIDADRQHRNDGVALDERAVAAAARMVAAADVGELPAGRGGDEQLTGIRVRERRPCAVE